jgi:LSD1 subclass zinc finger protein
MHGKRLVHCAACGQSLSLPRGALLVECECGMEYHAFTGQPVEEPICGLPSVGYNEGRRQA